MDKYLDSPVSDSNFYREVVSGETLDACPEIQKILKQIESPKFKAILIVDIQRLSRGDLEDAGRFLKLFSNISKTITYLIRYATVIRYICLKIINPQ